MFAFAVWDAERRELTLARDRYGVKPLYWARRDGNVLFGSEVKALLAHPGFRTGLDLEALAEYLTFQNVFTTRTLFEGVSLLAPGCTLRIGAVDGRIEERTYWSYYFREPEEPGDPHEYLEELTRLFRQAVNRQLVADVPVGAYLSGGMDSGSITAVAAQQIPELRTFTVGFDLHSASGIELGFDERDASEYMSYLFQTEHYEMVLKAGDMERVLPRLIWHLEEPRVGQSYPNFYAAQLASKFGKVVLAGAGGDELFGGYPWRYYRAVVNEHFDDYVDKYYAYWQRLLSEDALRGVMAPVWEQVAHVDTRSIFRDVLSEAPGELSSPADYVNLSLQLEARQFLHGLLVVEDKLSMAHSLETRVPFLDNDLVDFAMRVPVRLKLASLDEVVRLDENEPGSKPERFYQRANDGKMLLRQAMSQFIPSEVTDRIKQGFSAPDASWFRGESIDYVRRVLLDGDAALYDVLDRRAVTDLVEDHLEGRANRRLLIWSFLCLELWTRTFL
jgi:asparagine synthase (glutamine-hydrolysing)